MIAAERYLYSQGDNQAPQRLERAQRFIDTTGLEPLDRDRELLIIRNMQNARRLDHKTVWADPMHEHAFMMAEMYGSRERHAEVLNATGMPWIQVPDRFAIYGGGTTSYVVTFPWHVEQLVLIEQVLKSK